MSQPFASDELPPSRGGIEDRLDALPPMKLRAALIGRGIQKSRTPHMHAAEGVRLGIRYAYHLLDFDQLDLPDAALADMVRALRARGFAGFNVTHPFKQSVLSCLDGLSPNAAAIGAVNTVVLRNGDAIGHNTDCWGFAESFRSQMAAAGLEAVVLLGAGGAGMAVGQALVDLGVARLAIFDLDRGRAEVLASALDVRSGRSCAFVAEDLPACLRVADGLVNATPVGMAKYPGMPVPETALRPELWVADIVYFPAETELLRAAAALGCRVLPGRGMAIHQAVRAFELITGAVPDPGAMAGHFKVGPESAAPAMSD